MIAIWMCSMFVFQSQWVHRMFFDKNTHSLLIHSILNVIFVHIKSKSYHSNFFYNKMSLFQQWNRFKTKVLSISIQYVDKTEVNHRQSLLFNKKTFLEIVNYFPSSIHMTYESVNMNESRYHFEARKKRHKLAHNQYLVPLICGFLSKSSISAKWSFKLIDDCHLHSIFDALNSSKRECARMGFFFLFSFLSFAVRVNIYFTYLINAHIITAMWFIVSTRAGARAVECLC